MLGFMDNLGSQTAGPFKGLLKNQGIAPHFLPPGTTDNAQVVDGGVAFSHKHLTNVERDDWMIKPTGRPGAPADEINADRISTSKKDATGGIQHVSASELRVLVTQWAGDAWTKLCEGGVEGREEKLPFNMYTLGCKLRDFMSVDGSRDNMIQLQGWPKDGPPPSRSRRPT